MNNPNDSVSSNAETTSNPFVDQAKEAGMELVHHTQNKAGALVDQVQTQLKTRLTDEKNAASTSLEHVSHAFTQAGRGLREKDQESLGNYADSAAEIVDNLSGYLHKTSIDHFVKDIETVARKRPAVFIGGLFVVGLLAGRFLRSSGHHGDSPPAGSKNDPILPVPALGAKPMLFPPEGNR